MSTEATTVAPRGAPSSGAKTQGRYLLDREGVLAPLLLLPAIVYIVALVGVAVASRETTRASPTCP